MKQIKKETRVIFNTVPECVFSEAIVSSLPSTCLFIDLASAPGGIDQRAADLYRIKTIWATALPGKYAPETAGVHIADTIDEFLQNLKRNST